MKSIQERTGFFKKIGHEIALQISVSLTEITAEEIVVEFSDVRTFEQSRVFVGVEEKCFGTYMDFRKMDDNLEGIVVVIFPVSSTKILIELLLNRYLGSMDTEKIDHKIKLSAFKEVANIITSTYIGGMANILGTKIKTGVPKFVCFDGVELIRPVLLRSYSELDSLMSIGEFKISVKNKEFHPLKGALLLFLGR